VLRCKECNKNDDVVVSTFFYAECMMLKVWYVAYVARPLVNEWKPFHVTGLSSRCTSQIGLISGTVTEEVFILINNKKCL